MIVFPVWLNLSFIPCMNVLTFSVILKKGASLRGSLSSVTTFKRLHYLFSLASSMFSWRMLFSHSLSDFLPFSKPKESLAYTLLRPEMDNKLS